LLLTNPVDGPVSGPGRQDLLMRRAAALAASARLIAEMPAAVQNAQKLPRLSFLPRSDGWRDVLMEDSFVFRTPEPANESGRVDPGAAPDALQFRRKSPFKGG
jgi:hypothetical protein